MRKSIETRALRGRLSRCSVRWRRPLRRGPTEWRSRRTARWPSAAAVRFSRARANPSAVMHNVAGIMGLEGFQLTISSNVGVVFALLSAHGQLRRSGRQRRRDGHGVSAHEARRRRRTRRTATSPYPQVCKNPSVALAPMVLGTYRINRMFALGFGVYAPSTQGSAQNFDDRVTAMTPSGMSVLAPSPRAQPSSSKSPSRCCTP